MLTCCQWYLWHHLCNFLQPLIPQFTATRCMGFVQTIPVISDKEKNLVKKRETDLGPVYMVNGIKKS